MIKIEAVDLESAILEASNRLGCSYDDVDYHIIQEPVSGIFKVGKKSAIIIASIKVSSLVKKESGELDRNIESEGDLSSEKRVSKILNKRDSLLQRISQRLGYKDDEKDDEILADIKTKLNTLVETTCFEVDKVAVSLLNSDTVFIYIDGKDAPLLIGREGYRYKAINYVLQSWVNTKYDLKVQLEIGEFIKKQNEHIEKYLKEEVFEEVEKNGFFKTKILDDILVKLAIKKLRERYKNKYVKVRNTQDGSKFIVIDEFFTKKI
jgi:spoIIIJ-associated protein